MITQAVKHSVKQSSGEKHKRTRQGVSAKLESYIYKIHMVCATNNYTCPYIHATTSCPPQGHHVVYMCPDIIFQILLSHSRPMILHHVTYHVTAVSHASPSSKRKIKETKKENQYKIRKIKGKKNKIVSVQVSHNRLG